MIADFVWVLKKIVKKSLVKMITGMHQYSTIKTTYSDEKKSYVSDVNPFRPMIVQVDFEVCGEVSG